MSSPWIAGVQVRNLDRGTPVADFLCGACLTHKRVTGRGKVTAFLRDNPVTAHGPHCRPAAKTT
ncbi:transcription factor WhiB [Streptomyces spinosirectus]